MIWKVYTFQVHIIIILNVYYINVSITNHIGGITMRGTGESLLNQEMKMNKSVLEHTNALLDTFIEKVLMAKSMAKDKDCVAVVINDKVFMNRPIPMNLRTQLSEKVKCEIIYVELVNSNERALYPVVVFKDTIRVSISDMKSNLFAMALKDDFSKLFE